MRFFITGGTGFIGKHLVSHFLKQGHHISCLTRQSHLKSTHPNLEYIQGNLNHSVVCKVDQPHYDVILHFGALTARHPHGGSYSANSQGTQNLINTFSDQLNQCRFIYASSISVSDDGVFRLAPINETKTPEALTIYGQTKLSGERILLKASQKFKFSPTILRLTAVYGPGASLGGISTLIQFTKRYRLPFLLTPPSKLNFLYVEDIALICQKIIEMPPSEPKIYLVAEKQAYSLSECFKLISQQLNKKLIIGSPAKGIWNRLFQFCSRLGLNKGFSFQIRCITDNVAWCDSSKVTQDYHMQWTPLEQGLKNTLKDLDKNANRSH